MRKIVLAAAALLLVEPTLALAHPGVHADGLVAGLAHPLTGLDHLAAMTAVGFWAASLGQKSARWIVPLSFVALMIVGAGLALAGLSLPAVEPMIALSVAALGLLVAFEIRLPAVFAAPLVGFLALFHGFAHGTEMPAMAEPVAYGVGFALATLSLHLAGLGLGLARSRWPFSRTAARLAGAAVAGFGIFLFAN